MTITIASLNSIVLIYLLVFCRVGGMVMLMPAIGDSLVPTQVRLVFAVALSFVMTPSLAQNYHIVSPNSEVALALLVIHELIIGILIGLMARMLNSVFSVAGFFIANQSGLSMAQTFDPSSTSDQGAILGNFLQLMGTVVIFATNLHYLVISAVGGSYHLIPPGAALPTSDMAQLTLDYICDAFRLGFQLAAPFIVFGLVINLSFGVLSRLMPQLQIFFVVMPINVMFGFSMLAMFLGTMISVYLDFFSSHMKMLQ